MNQRNLHPSPHRWSIPSVLFRSLVVAACFVHFAGTRAIAQSVNLGDCDSAAFVCSDTLILGTSMSTGAVNDLLENCGCMCGGERSSAWIQINIATSGTLGLLLTPDQNNTDLDFAVWGPYTEFLCPQPVDPIRCSFASRLTQVSSNVGLVPFESDTSELANSGNGLVAAIALTLEDGADLLVVADRCVGIDNLFFLRCLGSEANRNQCTEGQGGEQTAERGCGWDHGGQSGGSPVSAP